MRKIIWFRSLSLLYEEEWDITEFLDMPAEDCKVLRFLPVLLTDDEDDDIFEPERIFSNVFDAWKVHKEKQKWI